MGDHTKIALAILLVEDDQVDSRQIKRLLNQSGLDIDHVACVETLEEAHQALGETSFDVLLLDLNLPDSMGMSTLCSLQTEHSLLPIVVVTGAGNEEVGLQAVSQGAQDYLVKGEFNTRALTKAIQYACERKQTEAALRDVNTTLEKANQDLKSMHAQVVQSEKLASIGQLAAGVAHELNTPVGFVASNFETLQKYTTKITNYLQETDAVLESCKAVADETVREQIASLQKERQSNKVDFILDDITSLFTDTSEGLSRVTSIVQNLRDFSRVDRADQLEPFNLNDGIRATLVVARNVIKYDADVSLELGDIPEVPCISGQINQVFLNIVVNAAQAIKMQNRDTRGTITIRTWSESDSVFCDIQDDGPGIPPETLAKIFEPFFTTKPVGKGTGLGLSVSYDIIINKHHGTISAESNVGEGTCFHISLPCPSEDQASAVEAQVQEILG